MIIAVWLMNWCRGGKRQYSKALNIDYAVNSKAWPVLFQITIHQFNDRRSYLASGVTLVVAAGVRPGKGRGAAE